MICRHAETREPIRGHGRGGREEPRETNDHPGTQEYLAGRTIVYPGRIQEAETQKPISMFQEKI